MKKHQEIGALASALNYKMQQFIFINLHRLFKMAAKTNGFTEPIEKINDHVYRSKENANRGKSGKESLKKIFEELLQDTYSAETQLTKALPEIAKASKNEDLQQAFENHLKETEKQIQRIEKIFSRLHVEKEGKSCKAMKGLIEESQEIITKYDRGASRDAALIV